MDQSIPTLAEVEREHVLNALRLCGYNRTHTASVLGISIRGLRLKLHQYGAQGISVPPPASGSAKVGVTISNRALCRTE
jgi:two-component system, response regulator FlrC